MKLKTFVKEEGFENYVKNSTYAEFLKRIWEICEFKKTGDFKSGYTVSVNETSYYINIEIHQAHLSYQVSLINPKNKSNKILKEGEYPEVVAWIGIIMLTKAKADAAKNSAEFLCGENPYAMD